MKQGYLGYFLNSIKSIFLFLKLCNFKVEETQRHPKEINLSQEEEEEDKKMVTQLSNDNESIDICE